MKISDLAAIVTVRNHIQVVINDKSVTSKDDFRPLFDAKSKLDKKFIEVVKNLDFNDLLTEEFENIDKNYVTYTPIGKVNILEDQYIKNLAAVTDPFTITKPLETDIGFVHTPLPLEDLFNLNRARNPLALAGG